MSTKAPKSPDPRKQQIDTLMLALPGVVGKKINGLDAYFVNDRMFACISGEGIGLRVPVAMANDLQFSRENVGAFQPAGLPSSKEWIQVNRADPSEYAKDVELFRAAHEFVKAARGR